MLLLPALKGLVWIWLGIGGLLWVLSETDANSKPDGPRLGSILEGLLTCLFFGVPFLLISCFVFYLVFW